MHFFYFIFARPFLRCSSHLFFTILIFKMQFESCWGPFFLLFTFEMTRIKKPLYFLSWWLFLFSFFALDINTTAVLIFSLKRPCYIDYVWVNERASAADHSIYIMYWTEAIANSIVRLLVYSLTHQTHVAIGNAAIHQISAACYCVTHTSGRSSLHNDQTLVIFTPYKIDVSI